MTFLAGNPLSLVNGEEATIMTDATVPTALKFQTPNGDVLINGSYKAIIATENETNPVDAAVILS